jgi:hypothetical protein
MVATAYAHAYTVVNVGMVGDHGQQPGPKFVPFHGQFLVCRVLGEVNPLFPEAPDLSRARSSKGRHFLPPSKQFLNLSDSYCPSQF